MRRGDLPDELPERTTVVFDGRCGFCTRSVGWLRAIDRRDRLELVASQQRGVRVRAGLTEADADAAVWSIAPGVKISGAAAVALAIATAWGNRLPLWPWYVPGLPALLEWLYGVVATNRGRLPGVTPWCEAHPGECDDV